MASDIPQSLRTSRSSFSSSNGYETPSHYSAITNGDDYDSDGSNFAPPTPMILSNSIPAELAGAIPLIDKFQVEGFLRAMQKQINSAGKRGFFSKRSVGPQDREKFTFEDMLCFQRDPIPTSLLKINGDLELAGIIKLSAFSSFSLFECRKVVTASKSPEANEEYVGLDDNKYIGDLLTGSTQVLDGGGRRRMVAARISLVYSYKDEMCKLLVPQGPFM